MWQNLPALILPIYPDSDCHRLKEPTPAHPAPPHHVVLQYPIWLPVLVPIKRQSPAPSPYYTPFCQTLTANCADLDYHPCLLFIWVKVYGYFLYSIHREIAADLCATPFQCNGFPLVLYSLCMASHFHHFTRIPC